MTVVRGYRLQDSYGFYNTEQYLELNKEDTWDQVEFPDTYLDHELAEWCQDNGITDELDIEDARDEVYNIVYENLFYWTIYFRPEYEDVEAAIEAKLVPFYYKGDFLLALGGCGMDLSPRLDAYQALVVRSLPPNSMFFKQRDYFESVVGKKLTLKIEQIVMLDWRKKEMIRNAQVHQP